MEDFEQVSTSGFVEEDKEVNVSAVFTEITEIPSGGFNLLLKARRYGRWWVLKGLKKEYREQALYRAMLHKEFDILIDLQHPGVITVVEWTELPEYGPCIVMEWIDGFTLKEWLKKKHSFRERFRVSREIINSLGYVHSKQVAHRDLKPSNIMVTRNGSYTKLIDFGLSDTDSHTILKQPAGTMGYMSPEQSTQRTTDVRNDIFSLGCILSEIHLIWPFSRLAKNCKAPIGKRYNSVDEIHRSMIRYQKCILFIPMALLALVVVLAAIFWPRMPEEVPGAKIMPVDYAVPSGMDDDTEVHAKGAQCAFNLGGFQYVNWEGFGVTIRCLDRKVEELELPETVEYRGTTYSVGEITMHCFTYSKHLKKVTIPKHLQILQNAFVGASSLEEIVFTDPEPPSIGSDQWPTEIKYVFEPWQFKVVHIVVPKGAKAAYEKCGWGAFEHFDEATE